MISNIDLIGTFSIVATIVIGFVGSFGLYWKQRKDKRRRLRKALRSELKSSDIETYAKAITSDETEAMPIPNTNPVSSNVYAGNTSEIGILSDEEIEKIVSFYSEAHTANNNIQAIEESSGDRLQFFSCMLMMRLLELNNLRNEIISLFDTKLDKKSENNDFYYVDLEEWDVEKIMDRFSD